MSEFIFANMLDKEPVGTDLGQSIPLHMTALHWFETDHAADKIISAAELSLSSIKRIFTRTTNDDLFGPSKDVPVMRLERTPELLQLHCTLLEAMEDLGVMLDRRWVGESNWNPHVTHKLNNRLKSNEEFEIRDIDLITRADTMGSRKIIHRYPLDKS
jgi:2'-5' RNA ligase